jgi:hypothetical protein
LTKQLSEESIPKCHIGLDEATKIVENTTKALDNSALFLCGTHINPAPVEKIRITKVKTRAPSQKTKLGKPMQKLYNLEAGNGPEKALKIEFEVDLYQMEDF